jgi:hypothetical protein
LYTFSLIWPAAGSGTSTLRAAVAAFALDPQALAAGACDGELNRDTTPYPPAATNTAATTAVTIMRRLRFVRLRNGTYSSPVPTRNFLPPISRPVRAAVPRPSVTVLAAPAPLVEADAEAGVAVGAEALPGSGPGSGCCWTLAGSSPDELA